MDAQQRIADSCTLLLIQVFIMQHIQGTFSWQRICTGGALNLMVLALLISQAGVVIANEAYNYPTGLRAPSAAEKAWIEEHVIKVDPKTILSQQAAEALPSRVVNIDYLPKVGRQAWGACAAWASTYYYKTWQEAREHGWHRPDPAVDPQHIMSPAFTFNLYNGGHDLASGPPALAEAAAEAPLPQSSIPVEFGYLTLYGAATISVMPANEAPYLLPTAEQIYAAFPNRALDVYALDYSTDTGMDALKAHLDSGDLATMSMALNNNFTSYPADGPGINNGVLFDNAGGLYRDWCDYPPCNPNHALTVIGYDDNKTYIGADGQTHSGAMLLVNSWGTDWGAYLPEASEAGFIWVGYDFFKSQTAGVANYMTDRINYQPAVVGSFGIKHERRGELGIRLQAGDPDDPNWEMDVLPFAGGPVGIDQIVPFDATDYATGDEMNFWLTVQDHDLPTLWSPPKTGTVTSFEIKFSNGHVWRSPDAPIETVDFDINNPDTITRLNISLLYKDADFLPDAHGFDTSHVWADLDGDGDADLLFFDTPGDYTQTKCRLFSNQGANGMLERGCNIPYFSEGDVAIADINRDGLADVAINGYLNNQPSTKIYFNLGNFLFADSGVHLPGSYGPMAWIDYNDDGRLDLSLLPALSAYTRPVQVLLQNTNGGFSPANLGLPATRNFAWADYNRDGWLDVAVPVSSGYALFYQNSSGALLPGPVLGNWGEVLAWGDADNDGWVDLALTYPGHTEVWQNNHDGSFSLYSSLGPSASPGGMSWGDINNDGLSDLAVWGDFGSPQGLYWNIKPRIYLNHGNGSFTNGGFNFQGATGMANTSADLFQWIDYDNDGDLDISIAGVGSQPEGLPRRFALYINHAADADGLDKTNTPPTAPALLSATQAQPDGPVRLSWSSGNDTETDPAGLFYNVRIGRNPTTGDIIAPDAIAQLDTARLHPTLDGNTPGLLLNSPPSPAFYWSVQSIDAAHARSTWSLPQLFSSAPGVAPGDLNADGFIDVADVLKTARMADGVDAANAATGDRNGDGKVDQKDVLLMENTLLGEATTGADIIAVTSIGPAGGTLSAEGFTLEVPQGAFSKTFKLTLHSSAFDKPFGANARSALFRLEGLPTTRSQPLNLRLLSNAPTAGTPYVALGQSAVAFDRPVVERDFSATPASDLGNGEFEIQLPASEQTAASLPAGALQSTRADASATLDSGLEDMRDDLVDADIVLVVGYFNNAYQSEHFNIMESGVTLKYTDAIQLAQLFEHAYKVLTSVPYNFKCQFNSSGKVDIYVKKMDSNIYGLEQSSSLGKLHNYIDVNFDKLADKTAMEQTAVHEFFHYIQDLYDPQSMRSKFYLGSRYLWLEEASSVWSEELAVNHDIPASVFLTHVWDSLGEGLHAGLVGETESRQYSGYGNASLIKYISTLPNGPRRIRNIYEDISLNKNSITAVLDYMQPIAQNWSNYATQLVTGKLFELPFGYALFVDKPNRLSIADESGFRKSKVFIHSFPDLSAQGFRLDLKTAAQAALTDKHTLSTKLQMDKEHPDDLQLFLIKIKPDNNHNAVSEVIGEATRANDSLKFDVPNIKQLYANGWKVYPLVVNRNAVEPYDQSLQTGLTMAVTSNEKIDLKAMDVPGYRVFGGVPMLHVTGSMQAGGWSDYEMKDFLPFDIGRVLPYLRLKIPGVTPRDMELIYKAEITNGLKIDPPDASGLYSTWSVSGLEGYTLGLSKYNGTDQMEEYLTIPSTDGSFNFSIPDDTPYISGLISASYTVTERRYEVQAVGDDKLLHTSEHHGMETAILSFFMEL